MTRRISAVFPPHLLKDLQQVIDTVPWRHGWHSDRNKPYSHWNHDFAQAGSLNGLDVSDRLQGTVLTAWQYLQANYLGSQRLLRCYANSHTYGVEGYPHTDSRRQDDYTMVIYMTPDWQRDWAGETVIYQGWDITHAELPRYNHGIIFPGREVHCARSVSRICPAQRITLMYKFVADGVDQTRDQLQRFLQDAGADQARHGQRRLSQHLLSVYDRLRERGASDGVCLAGGLHSIFGTTIYRHGVLRWDHDQALISTLFGTECLTTISDFKSLPRPQCLETYLESGRRPRTDITAERLNILCSIEAANLADQGSLKRWPRLQEHWERMLNEKIKDI